MKLPAFLQQFWRPFLTSGGAVATHAPPAEVRGETGGTPVPPGAAVPPGALRWAHVSAARRNELHVDTLNIAARTFLRGITAERILAIFENATQYIDEQVRLADEIEESDDHINGTLELRRAAVLGLQCDVVSGKPGDADADAAAEAVRKAIDAPWFTAAREHMLRAVLQQHAAIELFWRRVRPDEVWLAEAGSTKDRPEAGPPTLLWPYAVRPVEPGRWWFDTQGRPWFYRDMDKRGHQPADLVTPIAGQFLLHSYSATSIPGHQAKVRAVAKLWFLGSLGLTQWGTMIDQFGVPVTELTYKSGLGDAEIQAIVDRLLTLAARRIVAVPEGTSVRTDAVPDQTPHEKFQDFYRRAVSKLLLGQDSAQNAIEGQRTGATVQGRVRDDIRDKDALLLDASLNETFVAPFVRWNFGPGVALPRIAHRAVEQVEPASRAAVFQAAMALGLPLVTDQVYGDLKLERPDGLPDVLNSKGDADLVFKRAMITAFLADGTINDIVYNATDIVALLTAVNVPLEPGYTPPWAPVIAQPGAELTGNVVTDAQGDIVGADVADAPPAAGPFGAMRRRHRLETGATGERRLETGATGERRLETGATSVLMAAQERYADLFSGHAKAVRTLAEDVAAGGGSDAQKAAEFTRRLPEVLQDIPVEQRAELLRKAQLAAMARGILRDERHSQGGGA